MPSRRDQIRMSEGELDGFLHEQKILSVATIGPRGRPHLVPLWYVPHDGHELTGWTYGASQKARNLERDARATVQVEDGVEYHELRGVTMECDVLVEREPERVVDYGVALFERYGAGAPLPDDVREMVARQAAKRVGLRFLPTRIFSWDHAKLGGAY
ncbi:MAG: PPOX class F420-dependent oxidoreductase [Thermoleophilaceae bacterium]